MRTIDEILESKHLPEKEALEFYLDLEPMELHELRGGWKGSTLYTDHPLDNKMASFGWHGMFFKNNEVVYPSIWNANDGSKFIADPLKVITAVQSSTAPDIMGSPQSYLTTSDSARIRMVVSYDHPTATLIYNNLPIYDSFKRIDDDRIVGLVDMKGVDKPYFFMMTRDPDLASIVYVSVFALLVQSAVTYAIFHYNYIPDAALQFTLDYPQHHAVIDFVIDDNGILTTSSNQKYDVQLSLFLPDSPPNRALHSFPVVVVLNSGPTVQQFHLRSGLPYVSHELRLLRLALLWPAKIFDQYAESAKLVIPITSDFTFKKPSPSTTLEVQLPQNLYVYSLRVQFFAKLTGLKYFMKHHPFISALAGTLALWALEVCSMILVIAVIAYYILSSSTAESSFKSMADETAVSVSRGDKERAKRRHSGSAQSCL
ncbi:hypothetical protein CANCADRAFT_3912 [Tortispora caseinolytica NRRL Y-17796]|uniref:Uncharacterized protein n=1 Tax=Tortispora caseinolytica NRRL Y-17796 TaxID=767744 RepID=A0A1E4TC00_9ASCO|nr:hypothetical protein CANCADRAFT_3912 [Tortispora caseinolytica NRRL Y-17796]